MTCGSNEFGQLGITGGGEKQAQGGSNQLTGIEKNKLGKVQYIAAGRFHTIVVSQKSENEQELEDEDEEKENNNIEKPE